MMVEKRTNNELPKRLADHVRTRRRDLGLTQEALAEQAGLSANYVAKLEQGLRTPSLATLGDLATALRVDVSDLLCMDREREKDLHCRELRELLDSLSGSDAERLEQVFSQLLRLIRRPGD